MNADADKVAAKNPKTKGVIGYNATAAKRAWAEMQALLAEVFTARRRALGRLRRQLGVVDHQLLRRADARK